MIQNMNIKGEWIWRGVISAIGALVLYLSSQLVGNLKDQLGELKKLNSAMHDRVTSLELYRAASVASKFTLAEWVAGKAAIDAMLVSQDKRITRTEDAIISIKQTLQDALPRMENKIDGLVKRP